MTHLYLYANQITSLPETISDLSNLDILSLGFNQLTSLPGNICDLPSSIDFGVINNNLCEEYNPDVDNSAYYCIGSFINQDQSNCCDGPQGQENWTNCTDEDGNCFKISIPNLGLVSPDQIN